jgi:hypothetical protein
MKQLLSSIKSFAIFSVIIFMLPGCGKQPMPQKNKAALSEQHAASSFDPLLTNTDYSGHIEAKLIDIPTMVGSTLVNTSLSTPLSEGQTALAWTSLYEKSAIASFYEQEMLYAGWQKLGIVSADQITLFFCKPHQICTISIRDYEGSMRNSVSHIYLCITPHDELS